MKRIVVTPTDHGGSFDLPSQGTIEVRLPEYPPSLYQWTPYPIERHLLSMTAQRFYANRSKADSGGNRVFEFQAGNAGTTTLRFKLFRAWEGDKSIIERFEVTVNVG